MMKVRCAIDWRSPRPVQEQLYSLFFPVDFKNRFGKGTALAGPSEAPFDTALAAEGSRKVRQKLFLTHAIAQSVFADAEGALTYGHGSSKQVQAASSSISPNPISST